MAILFSDNSYRQDKVFSLLQENLPGIDLRKFPDVGNVDEIDYAIAFRPAPGSLQNLPNLKVIFMTSAGVDAIIHDDTLPDVPIVRNTDPHLVHGIREYVLHSVLHYHRFFDKYAVQQSEKIWKQYPQIDAAKRSVGIMGLGEMGMPAAKALAGLGFNVRSWSRSKKQVEGIESFYGADQFTEFLSATEILINILPLTDETRGILNKDLFSKLPKDAVVINIGRGPHLNEADLIDALDSGHLRAAAIDVFPVEPLPENNPLWSHPKIKITPHIASLTEFKNIAEQIRATIFSFERGEVLQNVVDRKRQY